jgi:hypothetical protein
VISVIDILKFLSSLKVGPTALLLTLGALTSPLVLPLALIGYAIAEQLPCAANHFEISALDVEVEPAADLLGQDLVAGLAEGIVPALAVPANTLVALELVERPDRIGNVNLGDADLAQVQLAELPACEWGFAGSVATARLMGFTRAHLWYIPGGGLGESVSALRTGAADSAYSMRAQLRAAHGAGGKRNLVESGLS